MTNKAIEDIVKVFSYFAYKILELISVELKSSIPLRKKRFKNQISIVT